jgi:hypothetical protein
MTLEFYDIIPHEVPDFNFSIDSKGGMNLTHREIKENIDKLMKMEYQIQNFYFALNNRLLKVQ